MRISITGWRFGLPPDGVKKEGCGMKRKVVVFVLAGILLLTPAAVQAEGPAAGGNDTEAAAGQPEPNSSAPASEGEAGAEPRTPAEGGNGSGPQAPAEGGDGTEPQAPAEGDDGTGPQAPAEGGDGTGPQAPAEGGNKAQPEGTDSGAVNNGAQASGEGEVTEPITKEDKPYLSLGANLSQEQRDTVLGLLGINPAELAEYDVIYTTIDEEYKYLGEYLPAETLGSRSLSSVLVVKRDPGNGINITTKNISYCTIGMYKNALITAGITDADIIVAAPFPISGTAALVGAMKAYAVMTGEEVAEENMDAALNELVLTGELAQSLGDSQQVEEFIAYLKQLIVENNLESEEEIRAAIDEASEKLDITLSEEEIQQIISLLKKISSLDLDLDSIMSQAKDLYDRLSEFTSSPGFWDKVKGFFNAIIDFFKGLFS